MARKQFCEISPLCYEIALRKEIFRRHMRDFFNNEKISTNKSEDKLEHVIYEHDSYMIKKARILTLFCKKTKPWILTWPARL